MGIASIEAAEIQNTKGACLQTGVTNRYPNTGHQGSSRRGLIFAFHKNEILEAGLLPLHSGFEVSLSVLSYSVLGLSPV